MSARQKLEELAAALQRREINLEDFLQQVQAAAVAELAQAQVDLDRQRRCGFPEVIFGQGKSPEVLIAICQSLVENDSDVLATRIDATQAAVLEAHFAKGKYNPIGRTFRIDRVGQKVRQGKVAIISAGTSDRPVVEEARETADWMGVEVLLLQDVGVAGPQRLLRNLHLLEDKDAVVVVAGMEGALPSMVGGFVACPVIAVPTSVGYGANLAGITPLLAMMTSCAPNVTVVNIDAGFKGAYVASLIARNAARKRLRGDGI